MGYLILTPIISFGCSFGRLREKANTEGQGEMPRERKPGTNGGLAAKPLPRLLFAAIRGTIRVKAL